MSRYNARDSDAIIHFASRLQGKTLRQALQGQRREQDLKLALSCGKGSLGNLIQHAYFGIPANSESAADFSLAGLELKVTPLKRTSKGLRSKERIVLNLIRYTTLAQERSFEASSFWKKNKRLLILFYIYEKDKLIEDLVITKVKDWTFPERDLRIIRGDWEKIARATRENRAHELSEGDTLYLGACTKGSGSGSWQEQADGPIAKQRAFSLKSSYVNHILEGAFEEDYDSILDDVDFPPTKTFEEWVVDRFRPFYEKSLKDISGRFKTGTKAKHAFQLASHAIAKNILGVEKGEIPEFERADVKLKTVRLTHTGGLKEAMSFRQIRYVDIVKEQWEDSMFYEDLTRRFFFVVFQDDVKGVPRLKRVKFWTMPAADLNAAQKVWEDTKKKVKAGRFNQFIGMADHAVAHVRPKARNAADKAETLRHGLQPKKCFWLGRDYVLRQITA